MKLDQVKFREWQIVAFERWRAARRRGIVSVVTGGGKTIFALHCLNDFRQNVPAATGLIVVPTMALLDQWIEEVCYFYDLSIRDIIILNTRSRIHQSKIHLGIINTVATIATNRRTVPVCLIVDECHRAASPTFRHIFQIPTEASLGLSATPERPYDDGLTEIILPNLGEILINYNYKDALRDEVIVPFRLHNIVFEFTEQEQQRYDKLTKAIQITIEKHGIESTEAVMLLLKRSRISNLSFGRIEITLKLVAQNRNKRILIFHEDIRACELICRILIENGISAGIYHSKRSQVERVQSLSDYRKGKVRVLVTCRALDEGFNVPETEIGIIAASTATYRQRIQRLGRVLRPATGKTSADIYSLVASVPEIRRLAEEATDLDGLVDVIWSRA